MKNQTVAILIPTKDRLRLLKRCLDSVFRQSSPPDEIIVVNDGGVDGTRKYLEDLLLTHPNLVVINRERSGGVNTARNQGIKIIRSDWIAFLDDDDEFFESAVKIIRERVNDLENSYSVAYFNTKIENDSETFVGGFQFDKLGKNVARHTYDPSYEETMTKFNLKGDCKQVLRRRLFENDRYRFRETVNGFESYTMNLIARDGNLIRYFDDVLTHIHQESNLQDRLSITAPKKNPWPMFVLHCKQLVEHWRFYTLHPLFLLKKIITMLRLLLRVTKIIF